jgi:PPOX class probable FMN-dependent enzyme
VALSSGRVEDFALPNPSERDNLGVAKAGGRWPETFDPTKRVRAFHLRKPKMARLASEADLRRVLPPPKERTKSKILDHLDEQAIAFLNESPFALLATTAPDGTIEVSPKGDVPGFIRVENPRQVLIPERAGNNLAIGLQNILATGRVGLIVMLPGTGETLRFSGRAEIFDDHDLLERLSAPKRPALLALRIHIERAYFHCARSVLRAGLWDKDTWPAPRRVSFGTIIAPQLPAGSPTAEMIDAYVVGPTRRTFGPTTDKTERRRSVYLRETMSTSRLKHYGWGREGEGMSAEEQAFVLDRYRRKFARETFETLSVPRLADLSLRDPRVVPPPSLSTFSTMERHDRAAHTYGKSYPDYVRSMLGQYDCAPDVVALLAWMGPLSRTMVTGLHVSPGLGPWMRSSRSSRAMKSALRLVCEVTTVSWRETKSSAPIMAIFCDWPGASTRKSAPRLAQARAR